jgi:hypothetical protein
MIFSQMLLGIKIAPKVENRLSIFRSHSPYSTQSLFHLSEHSIATAFDTESLNNVGKILAIYLVFRKTQLGLGEYQLWHCIVQHPASGYETRNWNRGPEVGYPWYLVLFLI